MSRRQQVADRGSTLAEAILLGIAQDAGVPQVGCGCEHCLAARTDALRRHYAACLALVDPGAGEAWLIDATPDIREQLGLLSELAPGCRLAGFLLTHAHMGHYLGLAQLGREAMDTSGVPVYATEAVAAFLRSNGPWSQLVSNGNIALRSVTPGSPFEVGAAWRADALPVPHRAEYADTVAYRVRGPGRTLLYCPDIDRWQDWEPGLLPALRGVDVAFLDGTFFDPNELPGRDMREVPHPLVTDTAALLQDAAAEVVIVHLNHTNPLLRPGPERAWLAESGLMLGAEGMRFAMAGG